MSDLARLAAEMRNRPPLTTAYLKQNGGIDAARAASTAEGVKIMAALHPVATDHASKMANSPVYRAAFEKALAAAKQKPAPKSDPKPRPSEDGKPTGQAAPNSVILLHI